MGFEMFIVVSVETFFLIKGIFLVTIMFFPYVLITGGISFGKGQSKLTCH